MSELIQADDPSLAMGEPAAPIGAVQASPFGVDEAPAEDAPAEPAPTPVDLAGDPNGGLGL